MIQCQQKEFLDIPCLVIRDDRHTSGPLLLYYHYWDASKGNAQQPDLTLIQLASEGMVVVCPDCFEHGERASDAQPWKTMNGWATICEVIEQTRIEAGDLLDKLLTQPYIKTERPQIAGISMGALVAQLAFADDKRWAALASVVGRSGLRQIDAWCKKAQLGTWADTWCQTNAPQRNVDRYTDRPLLFLDGGEDPINPPYINADTVRRINALGGIAEQIVDPDTNHAFSPAMRNTFLQWVLAHQSTRPRKNNCWQTATTWLKTTTKTQRKKSPQSKSRRTQRTRRKKR